MRHAKHGYTVLAAAIALACGVASAQDGIDPESGIDDQPSIGSSDEQAGQDRQHDVEGLDRSAEQGDRADAQAGDEFEPSLDGSESEHEPAAIDTGRSAEESERVSSEGGDPGQLDQLTQEHEDLGKFVEAVKAAGLAESLTGDTSYTVFAPTDDAFDSMPEDWLEPENREQLVSMLRAHIVADDVDQEMAKTLQTAQTIDGGSVDIMAEEDELKVGDAKVVEPDIQVGNLRVYAIDAVLSEGASLASAESSESGLNDQGADPEDDEEQEIAFGEDDSTLR